MKRVRKVSRRRRGMNDGGEVKGRGVKWEPSFYILFDR